jgi:sarcosine oxidase delta subunit
MLIFECPYCGIHADETELSPGGEAHLKRFGPGASDEDLKATSLCAKTPKACTLNAGDTPMAAENGFTRRAAP